jgi:hypothetical protein
MGKEGLQMTETQRILGMTIDSKGNTSLVGSRFEGRRFAELVLGPPQKLELSIRIENALFRDCEVDGVFEVDDGVTLRDVRDGRTITSAIG